MSTKRPSKFVSDCDKFSKASYSCLEEQQKNKSLNCKVFFDKYKTCKAEEREKRLAANRGEDY